MSKVKGPFAPIRLGLIEHMCGITPMECKVYLTAHLLAVRQGKQRGKVFVSTRRLAKLTGHKWDSVRRSVAGLEQKDYLKPIEGGWQILNFNGDNPANTLSQKRVYPKKGHTQKRDKSSPKMGEGGIPKTDNQLSQNGRGGTTKAAEKKGDPKPLDVRRNNKKEGSIAHQRARKAPDPIKDLAKEPIPDGVFWNAEDGVHFTEEWRAYLSGYLRRYSEALDRTTEKKLGTVLTKEEAQDVIEYLNERLLTDSRLRATEKSAAPKWKQFRAFVRNQFVRALIQKRKRQRYPKSRASPAEPKSWGPLKEWIGEGKEKQPKEISDGDT